MFLRFQAILQERQEAGGDDEFAIALAVFFIEHNNQCYAGCCRIKQAVGARYEDAPLEITSPQAYEGPQPDYSRFRALIEGYYRRLIGSSAVGVHVSGGARVSMVCNVMYVHGERVEL